MLQKQSKNKAKWKYLLLLPLIAGILTYVGCTDDSGIAENQTALSLEEQIADLEATLDSKEEISAEEQALVSKLLDKANQKAEVSPPKPWVTEMRQGKEIIELVEEPIERQEVINDVPFAVIEEVPTFPGCEDLDNDQRKKCMSENISSLVNKNFNIALGKELGLNGINRIYVRFKIDEQGKIADIGVRGPHPKLEEEARRVINLLPQMKPGKQRGKTVGVLYSLPIVFQVQ